MIQRKEFPRNGEIPVFSLRFHQSIIRDFNPFMLCLQWNLDIFESMVSVVLKSPPMHGKLDRRFKKCPVLSKT